MLLENTNAVIYGAAGAVGGAVARAFAREGARLFLTGRHREPVEAVAKEIVHAGNFADLAQIYRLLKRAAIVPGIRAARPAPKKDLRRTAARNMIRGGVPQSIAKRVTGHRSDSMFERYDIASMDDKLEALRKARAYAATRAAVGDNVSQFPSASVNATDTQAENERVSEGIWLGGRDSNPKNLPTRSNRRIGKPSF